jgi:hypothetical protein
MRGTSIWRVPAQGGDETQVIPSVDWQQFSVSAGGIYFTSQPDQGRRVSIEFHDFATGTSRVAGEVEGPLSFGLSVSPDRRSALVSKVERRGSDLMLVENFR